MDHRSGQKRAGEMVYPPITPFDQQWLQVDGGHQLYLEQCGNPDGQPVLVLHGGPGGGCSPAMRRYFDPQHYRIILFDQRGCGRSRPHASVEANTTWHLVADAVQILDHLGVDRSILFGGSWGATLALILAITHPRRVSHLVLRGVFLMTQAELDWFYGGGAAAFFPDLWDRFQSPIPPQERGDLIKAYHHRLFSGNPQSEAEAARIWTGWENALASVHSDLGNWDTPADYARAFARLENHYFFHRGFLDHDDWIMANLGKITHLGADIVQGRMDMICPPTSSYRLAQAWPRAQLHLVPLAGHALSEPGITDRLVRITDRLRSADPQA